MGGFTFPSEYFSPKATLECGQVFRFTREADGYFFLSADKACFLSEKGSQTQVVCEAGDEEYFASLFDLTTDYGALVKEAKSFRISFLSQAAEFSKGMRILRQDRAECFLSFVLSQQNNIPRIRKMLFSLCAALGEKRSFMGREYYAFPRLSDIAGKTKRSTGRSGSVTARPISPPTRTACRKNASARPIPLMPPCAARR